MSMPPYLRFPQNDVIHQKIWGFRPVNPTCGHVSLEKGTRFFAVGNMIFAGLGTVIGVLLLFTFLVMLSNHPSHQELLDAAKQSSKNGESAEDWVDKIYQRQSYALFVILLILFTLLSGLLLFINMKLNKAVTERDISCLKKCFLIILCFEAISLLTVDVETELFSAKFLLFDVPYTIFVIVGLIFTYSYIASLVNPDNSQNEDLNRIQFSA